MLEEPAGYAVDTPKGVSWWLRLGRMVLLHVLCLSAFWVGFGWGDVAVSFGLYVTLMFFVTAGYHRYFSHRTYKTSRVVQFVLAFGAMMTAQKGVLWWASHHRHHHKHSDTPDDVHSVRQGGFWWAHMGWLFHPKWEETEMSRVRDLAKYPELVWLDEHPFVPPSLFALACFLIGGWTGLVVWFLWTIVVCWHVTFTINSLAHVYGSSRYDTGDDSKNNFWLALLTMGEGWHNNHHHYQASANQGWFWYEVDFTYYALSALEKIGLVWDVRRPPEHVVNDRRHPVQAAIQSFRESAAKVRQDAIEALDDLQESVLAHYEGASDRFQSARAEAQASWRERRRTGIDEILARAEARLAELEDSAVDADRRARRALDEIRAAASEYMDEIRLAARRASEDLELRLQGFESRGAGQSRSSS